MTSCINNVRAEAGAWLAQKRRSAPPEGSAIAEHVGLFCQLQRAGGQPEILLPHRWSLKCTESARFASYASPQLLSSWACWDSN
jgi:hypothetical protein